MIPRPYESFSPLKRLYRQRELKGPEGAPASLPVTCTHLIKGQVMEVGRTSSYESELSDASKLHKELLKMTCQTSWWQMAIPVFP